MRLHAQCHGLLLQNVSFLNASVCVHCCTCIDALAGDPTAAEIVSGVNLADVGKCNCTSRYCAAAAFGSVPVANTNASSVFTLRASLPPFPFDNLGADASCSNCEYHQCQTASVVCARLCRPGSCSGSPWRSGVRMIHTLRALLDLQCIAITAQPCGAVICGKHGTLASLFLPLPVSMPY